MKIWDHVPKQHLRGTHRARSPAETLEAFRPAMRVAGITRLANLTGLDPIGLPVFSAIRPMAKSLSVSQGKGIDVDAARVSALMESLEMWHAENILSPLRQATAREMAPRVELDRLARFRTPAPDDVLTWIEGWDLIQDGPVWMPLDTVTLDRKRVPQPSPFLISSNGLASGNHLLEAISHAMCEVIERDAEALWSLHDRLDEVQLETVTEPGCRVIVERLQQAGLQLFAWDITSDVGVPAYGAAILEKPDEARMRPLGMFRGFGCHLCPGVALLRALSEAVQGRITYVSGNRDDVTYADYERDADVDYNRGLWEELTTPTARCTFTDQEDRSTGTLEGDVRLLLDALRQVGVERVAVADLSRPDVGVPVVKVVIPGLEPISESGCLRGPRAGAY